MRNYMVFLQKEMLGLLRTKRILALAGMFLFFAITSPLMARYMAEFVAMLVPAEEQLGFQIPDPVWTDSFTQFFGNLAQIGNVTVILLCMGAIVSERRRNIADLLFTKGLGYSTFVMAKFTAMAGLVLFFMLVSVLIVHFGTTMLFDTAGGLGEALLAGLLFALFMIMVVALTLLASAIAKGTAIAAMLAFIGFLAIVVISALPVIGDRLPGGLLSRSLEVSMGYYHGDLFGNVLVTLFSGALFLLLAVLVLRRQEGA